MIADPLILGFFGEAYSDAVLPFQIILVAAGVGALSASNSSALYGTGRLRFVMLRSLVVIPAFIVAAMVLIHAMQASIVSVCASPCASICAKPPCKRLSTRATFGCKRAWVLLSGRESNRHRRRYLRPGGSYLLLSPRP